MSANKTFVFPRFKRHAPPPTPAPATSRNGSAPVIDNPGAQPQQPAEVMDIDPAPAATPASASTTASAPDAATAPRSASGSGSVSGLPGPASDTSSPIGPSTPASVRDSRDVVLPSISNLLHERSSPQKSPADRFATPPEQSQPIHHARGASTSPAVSTASATPMPVPDTGRSKPSRAYGHAPARSWSGHEGTHEPWASPVLPTTGSTIAGATPASASQTSPSPLVRRAGGPGGSLRIARRSRDQDFPPSARMHNEFVFPARSGKARAGGGAGATSTQLERITSESAASRSNGETPGSAAATVGDVTTTHSPPLSDSASLSSPAHIVGGPGSSASGGLDILASVSASSELAGTSRPASATVTPIPPNGTATPRRRNTDRRARRTPSSVSATAPSVAGSVESRPTSPLAPSSVGHHSRHPSGTLLPGGGVHGGTFVYPAGPYPYPPPYPHHQRSTSLTSPPFAREAAAPYPYPPYAGPPPGAYVYHPGPPPREGVPYPGPAQVPYSGPMRSGSYRRPRTRAPHPAGLRRAGTVGHTHAASHGSVPVWTEWRDPNFGPPPPPGPPGVPQGIPAPGGGFWVHHPGPVLSPEWQATHRSVPSGSTAASAADRQEGVSPPSSATSLEGHEVPIYATAAATSPVSSVKRKGSGRHRPQPSTSSIDAHAVRMEQIRLVDRPDEEERLETDEDEREAYPPVMTVPAPVGPGYMPYPPGAEAHASGHYPAYPPPGYPAGPGVYPVPGGWVEAPYPPSGHPAPPTAAPDPRHPGAGHLRNRSMNDVPRPGAGFYPPPPPGMFPREELYPAPPPGGVRAAPTTQPSGPAPRSTAPKYECQWCGKRFTRPSSLKIHNHVHTGEKPYVCDVPGCHRSFSVQSNLRRHQKSHPPPDPVALAEHLANKTQPNQSPNPAQQEQGQDNSHTSPQKSNDQPEPMAA